MGSRDSWWTISVVIVVSAVLVLSCVQKTATQTHAHTHTHTQTDVDERFTPVTLVGVSKNVTLILKLNVDLHSFVRTLWKLVTCSDYDELTTGTWFCESSLQSVERKDHSCMWLESSWCATGDRDLSLELPENATYRIQQFFSVIGVQL